MPPGVAGRRGWKIWESHGRPVTIKHALAIILSPRSTVIRAAGLQQDLNTDVVALREDTAQCLQTVLRHPGGPAPVAGVLLRPRETVQVYALTVAVVRHIRGQHRGQRVQA